MVDTDLDTPHIHVVQATNETNPNTPAWHQGVDPLEAVIRIVTSQKQWEYQTSLSPDR